MAGFIVLLLLCDVVMQHGEKHKVPPNALLLHRRRVFQFPLTPRVLRRSHPA